MYVFSNNKLGFGFVDFEKVGVVRTESFKFRETSEVGDSFRMKLLNEGANNASLGGIKIFAVFERVVIVCRKTADGGQKLKRAESGGFVVSKSIFWLRGDDFWIAGECAIFKVVV